MTQHDLVLKWIDEFGSIIPAKMVGKFYKEQICGSEFPNRCRELFKKNILRKQRQGKYMVFFRNSAYGIDLQKPIDLVAMKKDLKKREAMGKMVYNNEGRLEVNFGK